MPEKGLFPAFGDRITLACSCDAEVAVPLIISLPRRSVVRIIARSPSCEIPEHTRGRRVVVRWTRDGDDRVFEDVFHRVERSR